MPITVVPGAAKKAAAVSAAKMRTTAFGTTRKSLALQRFLPESEDQLTCAGRGREDHS